MHSTTRAAIGALAVAACSAVSCSDPGVGAARLDRGGSTAATSTSATGPTATLGVVTHIVDGDTLDVRLGGAVERIRLIGIDTPESVKPDSPVECYGAEAADHLDELVPVGTSVDVVRDTELRDQYGRLLAYLLRQPDGLFVNLSMAADGYAATLTFPPNTTFADDIGAAVALARRHRLGLWAACPNPDSLFG